MKIVDYHKIRFLKEIAPENLLYFNYKLKQIKERQE